MGQTVVRTMSVGTSQVLDPQLVMWLRDRYRAVLRYRRRAIICFVVTMGLVTAALLICPRKYLSQAKLFVRVGRESVGLDPTATTGATIAISETRENEIQSVLEMIHSRALLGDVVRVLGADVVLAQAPPPSAEVIAGHLVQMVRPANNGRLAADRLTPAQEKAVRRLEKTITSDHAKKSSVITASCRAESPELAQSILEVFLAACQSQHVRANSTSGSLPFFTEQAEVLGRELEQATAGLRDAKNEVGVVSLETRRQAVESRIAGVRRDLQETQVSLIATDATIRDLQAKQATLPEWQVAEEVVGQPEDAVGTTRRTLYDLCIRERDLLTRYTAQHPLVIATRQQIDQADQLLARPSDTSLSETTRSPHPAEQQVTLRLLSEQTTRETLRGRQVALKEQLDELAAESRQLNGKEGSILRKQQKVDVLQASYGEYLNKLEQARIGQALGDESISNVNVVQPASFVSRPVSPQRTLIFVLALFVAATGSVGVTLVSEVLDRMPFTTTLAEGEVESPSTSEAPEDLEDEFESVSRLVAAATD